MSPERLVYDNNEAIQTINSEDNIVKTSNFHDGRSQNGISLDVVWVIQDIVLNVSTNFQPDINFARGIT